MIPFRHKKEKRAVYSPARTIVIGFFLVILIGGTLLLFPFSRESGTFASPDEIVGTYFTAVSATCVTGLVAFDTATTWSTFGQIIILLMIQTGGLGFMTMSVIFSIIINRKITARERNVIAQSLNLSGPSGIIKLMQRVLIGTFVIEAVGALILFLRFLSYFPASTALYYGIFHSVSAFCNAGFDLLGHFGGEFSSLLSVNGDFVILMTLALLIIIGGIGFYVWDDVIDYLKTRNPLSAYSRFVLMITGVLIALGTLLFLIFEFSNPDTLGQMGFFKKLLNAFFQSVTCRTAGFDAIGNGSMRDVSLMFSIVLMFIGGCSGSTAGGVKVSTVGLMFYSIWFVIRGKTVIVLGKRTVSYGDILRAMAIIVIGLILVFSSAALISLVFEYDSFTPLLFETVSAFATVGLSAVGTPLFGDGVKILLACLMFFGRVGILTITYSLLLKLGGSSENLIRYPEARMLIG